jgi:hypothetical protein
MNVLLLLLVKQSSFIAFVENSGFRSHLTYVHTLLVQLEQSDLLSILYYVQYSYNSNVALSSVRIMYNLAQEINPPEKLVSALMPARGGNANVLTLIKGYQDCLCGESMDAEEGSNNKLHRSIVELFLSMSEKPSPNISHLLLGVNKSDNLLTGDRPNCLNAILELVTRQGQDYLFLHYKLL